MLTVSKLMRMLSIIEGSVLDNTIRSIRAFFHQKFDTRTFICRP